METEKPVFDIRKSLETDLTASIALLTMLREDKQLFERVLVILEEYQEEIKKKEEALNEIE